VSENLREKRFTRRGMTKGEAAEYCGCESKSAFDTWVQKGIVPGPIPGTQRWDRKAVDLWLDRASNIVAETKVSGSSSVLEQWLAQQS
jgi:hypothetical protein